MLQIYKIEKTKNMKTIYFVDSDKNKINLYEKDALSYTQDGETYSIFAPRDSNYPT